MEEILGIKTYKVKEAAEILKVSPRTIQQYIMDKKIPAQKIGGKWHITEDNLKAFIEGK